MEPVNRKYPADHPFSDEWQERWRLSSEAVLREFDNLLEHIQQQEQAGIKSERPCR